MFRTGVQGRKRCVQFMVDARHLLGRHEAPDDDRSGVIAERGDFLR